MDRIRSMIILRHHFVNTNKYFLDSISNIFPLQDVYWNELQRTAYTYLSPTLLFYLKFNDFNVKKKKKGEKWGENVIKGYVALYDELYTFVNNEASQNK